MFDDDDDDDGDALLLASYSSMLLIDFSNQKKRNNVVNIGNEITSSSSSSSWGKRDASEEEEQQLAVPLVASWCGSFNLLQFVEWSIRSWRSQCHHSQCGRHWQQQQSTTALDWLFVQRFLGYQHDGPEQSQVVQTLNNPHFQVRVQQSKSLIKSFI